MFREADTFFTSLGLPEMPQEFWNHLIIEQPTDEGEVICTSATFDFYNKRDFGYNLVLTWADLITDYSDRGLSGAILSSSSI